MDYTAPTLKNHACLLICLGLLVAGCQSQEDSTTGTVRLANGTLQVCCTSNIVKDLVTQVGGPHVSVTAIMDGPGVDPHLYTPTPQDINALSEADVVVYSGLHLEAQLEESLDSLQNRGVAVIKATQLLEDEHADALLRADGVVDPHVWFDGTLWGTCSRWLAAELGRVDPDHAAQYAANAVEFQALLARTQDQGQQLLDAVPAERRVLVTAHDAFQYFARTFSFQVEAVQGLSTESEPGLKRINELATLLVDRQISAIYTEQSVSNRNIQALIAECASRGHALHIGGTLYSDTAGPANTPEATLAGALLHNIQQIVKGLAPPSDDRAKL